MLALRRGNMSWETCNQCGKTLSCKQVLRRHEKVCKAPEMRRRADRLAAPYHNKDTNTRFMRKDIPGNDFDASSVKTFLPTHDRLLNSDIEAPPVQPKKFKIQSLVDEIMNDKSTEKSPPQAFPGFQKSPLSTLPSTAVNVPPPPTDVITSVFQEQKPELIIDEILPPVKSKPRTKAEIIGFSDGSSSTEDNDDDDDESDTNESIDISDITPPTGIQFLPATIDGLCDRFRTLWAEFTRHKKHEHRNEIVFLLDELLRQKAITQEDYKKVNNLLAESLGSGIDTATRELPDDDEAMEDEVPEEEGTIDHDNNTNGETLPLKKLIQSTFEYLIQPDKKELMEIINELRKDADTIDIVQDLEELIDVYLLDEFIDGEQPIRKKLDEIREKLEHSSSIPKIKHLRLKILLDDIAHNRYRVQTILKRTADAINDKEGMALILKKLAREELLSDEQYLKLAQLRMDELNSSRLADIIKKTKVGQGIKFLPRKLIDLTKQLQILLKELAKSGASAVRDKVTAVLEELLRQNGITQERYNSIKDENDIP